MQIAQIAHLKKLAREPNVGLVMLYWDTDMFRSSKQDREFKVGKSKPYSVLFKEEMAKAVKTPGHYPGYNQAKELHYKVSSSTSEKTYQEMYQLLIAGDPKNRTYRAITMHLYRDTMK